MPLVALALAGCHARPDVEACERFVRAGLGQSAGYARVSVDSGDVPADPDTLATAAGLSGTDAIARAQRGLWQDEARERGALSLRRVALTYRVGDAEPATRICGFAVAGDTLERGDVLLDRADRSAERARLHALTGAGGSPEVDCCLAP